MKTKIFFLLLLISTRLFGIWESEEFKEFSDNSNRVELIATIEQELSHRVNRRTNLRVARPYFRLNDEYYNAYDLRADRELALNYLKSDFSITTREELLLKVNFLFDKGYRFTWYNKLKEYKGEVTHQSLFIRDFFTASTLLILGVSAELISDDTFIKYADSIPVVESLSSWEAFTTFLASSYYIDNKDMVRSVALAISYDRANGFYSSFSKNDKNEEYTRFNMNFPKSLHKDFVVIRPIKDHLPEGEFIKCLELFSYESQGLKLYEEYKFKDELLWNGESYIQYFTENPQSKSAKLLLEKGFDPNKVGKDGVTGFSALIKKDVESDKIPLYLKYGADPLKGMVYNLPTLSYIIYKGGSLYLNKILENIENLDFEGIQGWHYIHLAARYLSFNDFKMVYDRCNDLSVKTPDGYTALDLAKLNENYDKDKIVELLSTE